MTAEGRDVELLMSTEREPNHGHELVFFALPWAEGADHEVEDLEQTSARSTCRYRRLEPCLCSTIGDWTVELEVSAKAARVLLLFQ